MFGTMGFSELIIILVIVLIIFGAGKLPQIGEGVGKALKGFKKEVNDIPPPENAPDQNETAAMPAQIQAQPAADIPQVAQPATVAPAAAPKATSPYTPGPELTPGTTAALMAAAGPQGPASDSTNETACGDGHAGASGSGVGGCTKSPASDDGRAYGGSCPSDARAVSAPSARRPEQAGG
jgi:TatA/E family protein of Tat protein translocase